MQQVDDSQYNKYIYCRKALGVSLFDVLKQAKHRQVSLQEIEAVFDKEQSRDDAICALRDCGMSLDDIGKVIGLTRERVRQIVEEAGKASGKAAKRESDISHKAIPEELVLRLICTSPRFWGERGALLFDELISYFAQMEYSESDVRDVIKKMRLRERSAKPRVLITYWFNIPESEHLTWLTKELTNTAQAQLLDRLHQSSPVKVSIMAFNRYMRDLGITAWVGAQGIRRSVGQDDDWSWITKI